MMHSDIHNSIGSPVLWAAHGPSRRPGDYGLCDFGHYFTEGDAIVMVDGGRQALIKAD